MYTFGGPVGDGAIPPGSNVLVSGPPLSGKRSIARAFVHAGLADEEGSILISTRDTAERLRAEYDLAGDDPDGRVGILDAVSEHIGHSDRETEDVRYAGAPKDMSGIEIQFSEFIETYYGERAIQRNRIVLDSITTLLMYANLQQVFHFLHSITSRVEEIDAVGLFLVDASVHDDRAMNTVRRLFDGQITTALDEDPVVELPDDDGPNAAMR